MSKFISALSALLVVLLALATGCAPKAAALESVAVFTTAAPTTTVEAAADQYASCRISWQKCEIAIARTVGLKGAQEIGVVTSREAVTAELVLRLQRALPAEAHLGTPTTELSTENVEVTRWDGSMLKSVGYEYLIFTVRPEVGSPRARPPQPVAVTPAENPKVDKTEEFKARCRAKAEAGYTLTQRCLAAIQ